MLEFYLHGIFMSLTNNTRVAKRSLTLDISGFPEDSVAMLEKMHAALMSTIVSTIAVQVTALKEQTLLVSEIVNNDESKINSTDNVKNVLRDQSKAPTNILDDLRAKNKAILAGSNKIPPSGWNMKAISEALKMLPKEQRNVLLRAASNGGQVSREEVYDVAKFLSTRSLKGFTRPTRRVTGDLQEKNVLPKNAESLLSIIYDSSIKTFKPVQGFSIPLDVIELIKKFK